MTAPSTIGPARPPLSHVFFVAALVVVAASGIARIQPRVADRLHVIKEREDVYAFPPPTQLRVLSLGYNAAVADLLWADLLVEYGTHWQEKREFTGTPRFYDAILAIDPTYPPLYKFADTLICYRPLHGTEDDARITRMYLERGTRERPWDNEVWLNYGQFLAFLGGSFLTDKEEIRHWKQEGAVALTRAVELGARPFSALAAAAMLGAAGERDASIRQLQRTYAVTDDEEARERISSKLRFLEQGAIADAAQSDIQFVEEGWHASFPFLSRNAYLLLGPMGDPLACAGPENSGRCARDWSEALKNRPLPTPVILAP